MSNWKNLKSLINLMKKNDDDDTAVPAVMTVTVELCDVVGGGNYGMTLMVVRNCAIDVDAGVGFGVDVDVEIDIGIDAVGAVDCAVANAEGSLYQLLH